MSNNPPFPLLMTRPLDAARAFVASLPEGVRAGLTPIYTPLLTIAPLEPVTALTADEAVIFTSANGVAHGPDGDERDAFCVGAATTQAAQARGWHAKQAGEAAKDLLAHLISHPPTVPLVHLSGVHTRGDVVGLLIAAGIPTRNVPIYDQHLRPLTDAARAALTGPHPVLVPLFSPRTAKHFFDEAPRLQNQHIIAISDAVAACVPDDADVDVTVSAAPNGKSMAEAVEQVLMRITPG